MSLNDRLEDLNLSNDEVRRLQDAFKNEEFRKLFAEYAEEISDPKNRAQYEAELRQLENERGMDVKFVNPEPGHVLKTTVDGVKKAFINVCKNDLIAKPSSEKRVGDNGRTGLSWSIPHSVAPGREDVAKNGDRCMVYDFVVNSDMYRMLETNAPFRKMVNDLAVETVCKQLGAKLDTKNIKFPKMNYKGVPTPSVIRTRLPEGEVTAKEPDDVIGKLKYPYSGTETSVEKASRLLIENAEKAKNVSKKEAKTTFTETKKKSDDENEYTTPSYEIKHRCEVDMQNFTLSPGLRTDNRPTTLIVEIHLPLLSSAKFISLDMFEKRLKLKSTEPAKYSLDLSLPYAVDDANGSASFDKVKRKLVVKLPVLPPQIPVLLFNGDSIAAVECCDNKVAESVGEKSLVEVLSEENNDTENSEEITQSIKQEPAGQIDSVAANGHEGMVSHKQEFAEPRDSAPGNGHEEMVSYILPEYLCHQDKSSVTFLFKVARVKRDKATVQRLGADMVQVKFVSIGDGGFPIHYSFVVQFEGECKAQVNGSDDWYQLDCAPENITLVIFKIDDRQPYWNYYKCGPDPENLLLEGKFLTDELIESSLENLTAQQSSQNEESGEKQDAQLDVNSTNHKKLVLNITKVKRSSSPTGEVEGGEVVKPKRRLGLRHSHDDEIIDDDDDKTPPQVVFDSKLSSSVKPLPGILKQRTVSESSDGTSPVVTSPRVRLSQRQVSINTVSDQDDDDDDDDDVDDDDNLLSSSAGSNSSSGLRKSVSFSDHVDTTTYSSSKSVSTMCAALKSKRKRARKQEQRAEQKVVREEARRRRRNSGSISLDSGDEPVVEGREKNSQKKQKSGAKCEKSDSKIDKSLADKCAEDKFEIDKVEIDKVEINKAKIDKVEINKVEINKVEIDKAGIDKVEIDKANIYKVGVGLDRDNVSVLSVAGEALSSPVEQNSGIEHSDTGVRTPQPSAGSLRSKSTGRAVKSPDGDIEPTVGVTSPSVGVTSSSVCVTSSSVGVTSSTVGVTSSTVGVSDVGDGIGSKKVDGGGGRPDTMLSWQERGRDGGSGEHKTVCAVQFCNNVMFDLDDE